MTDRRNDREADRLAAEAAAVLQGADDRRRRGAFFTPPDVAAALVGHVVGGGTVVDPACGAGVFLLATARRLYEKGCADRRTLVRRCLFGAEVGAALGAPLPWRNADEEDGLSTPNVGLARVTNWSPILVFTRPKEMPFSDALYSAMAR